VITGDDRQQTEPSCVAAHRGLDVVAILDGLAEHLVAAADPEQDRRRMRNRRRQATIAQPCEVGDDGTAPREHDEVRVAELAGRIDPSESDVGFDRERFDVGEVRDAGRADHRDIQRAPAPRSQGIRKVEAVFAVEQPVDCGNDPEDGETGTLLEDAEARSQKFQVAAEPVDDEPADPPPEMRRQKRDGAVRGGQHPASVDVGHDDHRELRPVCEGQIREVAVEEVEFGGAARAFDHHDRVFVAEPAERPDDRVEEFGARDRCLERGHRSRRTAEDDELGSVSVERLDQDRVHIGTRGDARSLGLGELGSADLGAVVTHRGVVRHVLRLERDGVDPCACDKAAQPGHDRRLARAAARTTDHQRA
jgi:hypothetical protein